MLKEQDIGVKCQTLKDKTTLHGHDTTVARGRHKPIKRARIMSHFMHNGYHMCIHTFAFLFGIGTKGNSEVLP